MRLDFSSSGNEKMQDADEHFCFIESALDVLYKCKHNAEWLTANINSLKQAISNRIRRPVIGFSKSGAQLTYNGFISDSTDSIEDVKKFIVKVCTSRRKAGFHRCTYVTCKQMHQT